MIRSKAYYIILILTGLLCCMESRGQILKEKDVPPHFFRAIIDKEGDTIATMQLREVIIYPELRFKNRREKQNYDKLVRDVKRTLPYAKMVFYTLIETYEYMETLPDDKAREQHLKRMEKDLFQQYKPELKRLTLSQGKLLIKLIDRECNQSSYNLLRAYLGGFRAGFWNIFASVLGASLKSEYDPKGKDALTERVVMMVERGLI